MTQSLARLQPVILHEIRQRKGNNNKPQALTRREAMTQSEQRNTWQRCLRPGRWQYKPAISRHS